MPEGYHDFSAGEDLTAANLESYCELQGIMRFASSAARDTALSAVKTEGMFAYTLDLNTLWMYNGAAWTQVNAFATGVTYSPTPTFGGSATNVGSITARWNRMGRFAFGSFVFVFSGAPNTGGFAFSFPVAPLAATDGYPLGTILMDKAGSKYFGNVVQNGTGGQCIGYGQGSAAQVQITGTSPVTWANGDFFRVTFAFETNAD